jgi:hypothetical protein
LPFETNNLAELTAAIPLRKPVEGGQRRWKSRCDAVGGDAVSS